MGQIAGLKGGTSVLPSARVLVLVAALLRLSDTASAVGRLSEALVQWRAGRAVTDPVSGIAVSWPQPEEVLLYHFGTHAYATIYPRVLRQPSASPGFAR